MESEKKSNGAFVGLTIIIVILIVGGIYIWMKNKNNIVSPVGTNNVNVTSQDTAELNSLEQDAGAVNEDPGVDLNSIN